MSKLRLENKVAVITGGNSGIGLATAKLFRDQGATVVITARSPETLARAQAEYGEVFDVIQADVSSEEDLQRLADEVQAKHGGVDVLYANAGIAHFAPLSEVTSDFFDKQFNTNVKGLLFTVQKFLPILNQGASVLLTTSGVNTKGMPGASVYAATKAAVRSIARTLSAELVGRAIRVNAISPGPVETPIFSKMNISEEELNGMAAQIESGTPVGRFGQPEEIAKAALFLASDDSSFVLGAELVADGGFSQI